MLFKLAIIRMNEVNNKINIIGDVENGVEEGMDTTATLAVHAYDWTVKDVYGDDDHVAIHCWALDRESKPYLLRFNDFPAFCHVELPMFVRGRTYQWGRAAVSEFMRMLSERLGKDAPIRYIFKQARKTYYYRCNRKFPMLQLCFNNLSAMNHCYRMLENPLKTDDWGFIKCNVWEDSICIVRKLLTVRDVRYSQWFTVTTHRVEPELRISTLEREYIAEWDTMRAIPFDECKGWTTQPGVLGFDIECYSKNHRAMPDKYDALHVAYMISCIYQRYRNAGTRRRYGIIIGDCNDIPPDKLDNCEIIRVNSEYEVIEAFGRIVRETDPEIVTGYNILGFDYPYLDNRVKRLLKKWPVMGRIIGEPSIMTSKTWKSGAYGHQSINILQMEGRISIDLLPIVKRDFKLEKYDLNTVCKKFIGKTKHDMKAQEMFIIYEDIRNTHTALVSILREAQENPELIKDEEYIKRRESAQEAFEAAKSETTRVMEYCIQDSELVIELMEKMNIWVGMVEMSNIVGTTIVELFTRGQQVRCLSQIYDLAARMGFVLDKRDTPGIKLVGGFVHDPIPGIYDNIICLDFASLYPSIMMAYNICYTTLVPPELEYSVPDEDCNIIEFDQDEIEGNDDGNDDEEVVNDLKEKTNSSCGSKGKSVKKHYRFKFYKNQEGLLPRLVRQLVAERRAINRQIAQIKDEIKALEKTEDARIALEGYLNGIIKVGEIKALEQRVKDLSESKPPPEVITAAKKDLAVAQLFNLAGTTKRLNDALASKPPTHPVVIELARLELEVAQLYANNREGLPAKLEKLQQSRAERVARIEEHKVLIVVLDKRQLALKITANSFFGFLGVQNRGKMPLIEGAMSITAKGRELIGSVRSYIEDRYQGVQIYGDTDSCLGHTPTLIRYSTGTIDYVQIKDIISLPAFFTEGKEYHDLTNLNIEVWTDRGWSKIKYLMRHKTLKKLYRVVTHTGIVDVTEDHSLLNENAKEVTPNNVAIGMNLLHNNLPNLEYQDPTMNEDKAWVWGFFMAEGTCDTSCWYISNKNHDFLNRAQLILNNIESDYSFVIEPCMKSSNVDKVNATGDIVSLVNKYEFLFYTERSITMKQTDLGIRFKKVPYQILMAPNNIKLSFIQGLYDADGTKKERNSIIIDIKGQIGAAGLFYLASAVGYKVSINTRTEKEEFYRLTLTANLQRRDQDKIKKIIPLGYSLEYVYDIETENHHFGAGIGRMIVHNSVMMRLPQIKDSKECNYWGVRLSQEISGIKPGETDCDGVLVHEGRPGLFPPPLSMEFEKAMRLLCLTKKKYAAYLIGKDGTFKTEDITDKNGNVIGNRLMMLKKGIVLARRDNCLTGDSLVTLSNGTSVAIKNLTQGNAKLYGWNGIGTVISNQTAFIPQGRKRCLKINIIDGRTITCTPEHRLLIKQTDGSIIWKEARNINISTDKVICGLEAPEDIIGEDEITWKLDIGGYNLDMSTHNRSRTLAFMRILGYINSDGSLSIINDGRIDCSVHMGHILDVNAMLDDIELVCGIRPAITERSSSFYQITIPYEIIQIFIRITGQTEQSSSWPTFLLEANCPKAILREFCGGLFGGDGISPYLSKHGVKRDSHEITQPILIGMSTRLENQNSLKVKMEILCDILARAGYPGCELSDSFETFSHTSNINFSEGFKDSESLFNSNNLRVMYRIKSPSSNKCGFLRTIGYRYCIHKLLLHTAAQSLWRFEETVKSEKTLGKQLRKQDKLAYKQEILTTNTVIYSGAVDSIGYRLFYEFCHNGPVSDNSLRRYCTFPNTLDWLNDIGALSWFDKDGHAVNRSTMNVPVLYLPVHSIIDGGEHEVYDISVDLLDSFIANGVIVHNCKFLRETYTRILDMIMNKGGLYEAISLLVDAVQYLLDGKVPYEDLIIIRELGDNYKSDSYFMKVFSVELKKLGKIVNPGDRLDFLIVEDPTATLLGHKMRLVEQYTDSLNYPNPERIDYYYYIEKVLMNPINQLFEVGFKEEISQLQHVSYRPTNRHKIIHLDLPLQIILKMLERGYDLKLFKEAVGYNVMKLKGMNPIILNVTNPQTHVPIPSSYRIAESPEVELNTTTAPSASSRSRINDLRELPHRGIPGGNSIPLTLNIIQPRPTMFAPTTPTLIMPRMALKSSSADTTKSPPISTIPVNPLIRPVTLNITTLPKVSQVPQLPQLPQVVQIPRIKAIPITGGTTLTFTNSGSTM